MIERLQWFCEFRLLTRIAVSRLIEYVPNRLLLQADEYAAALLQVWRDRVLL